MTASSNAQEFIPRVAAPDLETLREVFSFFECYLEKTGRAPKRPHQTLSSPKLVPLLCALARRHRFALTGPSEPSYLHLQQCDKPPLVFERYMGSHLHITQTFILAPHLAIELSLYYSRRRRRIDCCEVLVYDARLSRAALPRRNGNGGRQTCPKIPNQMPPEGEFVAPYWFSLEEPEAQEVVCASWARALKEQKWTSTRTPQHASISPVFANWPEYDAWVGALIRGECGTEARVQLVKLPVPATDQSWNHRAP